MSCKRYCLENTQLILQTWSTTWNFRMSKDIPKTADTSVVRWKHFYNVQTIGNPETSFKLLRSNKVHIFNHLSLSGILKLKNVVFKEYHNNICNIFILFGFIFIVSCRYRCGHVFHIDCLASPSHCNECYKPEIPG